MHKQSVFKKFEKFVYHTRIQETDLDGFGHLNNANYLRLFEHARWDFINQRGFSMERIQEIQQGPVILEVTLRFLSELKAGDQIYIESQLIEMSGKIGKLSQIMFKPNQHPCCQANFTIAYWDLSKRKIIKPTPEWLNAVGAVVDGE